MAVLGLMGKGRDRRALLLGGVGALMALAAASAAVGPPPIPVTGLQPDRFAVMLGGAGTARVTPAWRVQVSYDAEIRGGDVAHLVTGGVKGQW